MNGLHGIVAEFDNPEDLVVAVHKAREQGYTRLDAYTPFPIHGLSEAIGFKDNRVPWIIFIFGLLGAAIGYGLQYYITTINYQLNIGGRPTHSWPHYIPVTFESAVLLAAFAAVLGMLALNGLPHPHHPIFNHSRFELATDDRFFLCIEADDPKFSVEATRKFLQDAGATEVQYVET